MSESIYHGWTPETKIAPANRIQLQTLAELVSKHPKCQERTNALAAIDNALDCLSKLGDKFPQGFTWIADAEADAAEYADEMATREDALQIGLQ
jgi:hypothetical protein